MTLAEAIAAWREQRSHDLAIEAWLDAGRLPAGTLEPLVSRLKPLKLPDAKRALKDIREEHGKDAFVRLFSAFEQEFRAAFCLWLGGKCGVKASVSDLAAVLPESTRSLVNLAVVLEPRLGSSRAGYVGNVIAYRNDLLHRGFVKPMSYDLETLYVKLVEIVSLF